MQGDIASMTPDDVRKYHIGSVLAGGSNSDPGGKYDASPAQWLKLADAYYEASFFDGAHVIVSVKHFLGDGGTIDGKDRAIHGSASSNCATSTVPAIRRRSPPARRR